MKKCIPFLMLFVCQQANAALWIKPFDKVGAGDPILIEGNAVGDAAGVDLLGGAGIDTAFDGGVSPDTGTFTLDLAEAVVGSGILPTTNLQLAQRQFGAISRDGYITGQGITSIDVLVTKSHDAVTVTGEDYLTLLGQEITQGTISDTHLTAEDFGDFTCDSAEDGCTLDTDSVDANELNATGVEAELEAALDIAGDVSSTGMATTVIGADKILESMLKAVDAAADEECLTREETTGDFEWQACGSGSDTNAVKTYVWPASATLPLEAADSIPPISKDAGTNIDQLTVAFDAAVDECRGVNFQVPTDVTSGTVTFEVNWYSAAATTGAASWYFSHNGGVDVGTDPDQALTLEAIESDTTAGTAGQLNIATGTETIANLGWAAGEQVDGVFCRDGDGSTATDDLVGDALATQVSINIPRA